MFNLNPRRTICMRVELYGCPWEGGVLSYSMPQVIIMKIIFKDNMVK